MSFWKTVGFLRINCGNKRYFPRREYSIWVLKWAKGTFGRGWLCTEVINNSENESIIDYWHYTLQFIIKHRIVDFFESLTLPVQCIFESCVKIKIKLNFYFRASLWCLKRFYEDLLFFFSSSGIGTGSVKTIDDNFEGKLRTKNRWYIRWAFCCFFSIFEKSLWLN